MVSSCTRENATHRSRALFPPKPGMGRLFVSKQRRSPCSLLLRSVLKHTVSDCIVTNTVLLPKPYANLAAPQLQSSALTCSARSLVAAILSHLYDKVLLVAVIWASW